MATILVLGSPKSSEAIEGSDHGSTPNRPTFGAAGAQGGSPGPSTTRALRERGIRKPVYSGYASDELEDGKQFGCWVFCSGVVGFFYKCLIAIGRILMFLLQF